jgi:hypothetical protein
LVRLVLGGARFAGFSLQHELTHTIRQHQSLPLSTTRADTPFFDQEAQCKVVMCCNI